MSSERSLVLAAMRRDDLPQVVAIEASTSPRPWSTAAFLAELDRADRRYLVATEPSRGGIDVGAGGVGAVVVGFGGVALLAGDAHVMTVAVAPDAQRGGVGTAVVHGLLAEAAAAGMMAATLEVRRSNRPARRLYGRVGFRDDGVRPRYYPDGEDAVIMWLRDLQAR